ncbi:MAG: AcrR family transcriptional regulator [Myxococcota bacterium]|jgi:AcrR family transcriptional regulator
MGDRKQQILNEALGILVSKGYASLSMRAVARASRLTLGALQYHYSTRVELVQALAMWIAEVTEASFEAYRQKHTDPRDLHAMVDFMLEDHVGDALKVDLLGPQLWAMALVEPAIQDVLDDLYDDYLQVIEQGLRQLGVSTPRADAIVIMSMMEGLGLFVGDGRRWQKDASAAVAAIHGLLESRYGKSSGAIE